MDHDDKVRVAEEIARRVVERFGQTILFGTLSGSVARGEDTERSDLEIVFVTRDRIRLPGMSPDGYREFLFRGLQTQIEFRTRDEVLETLSNVGPYWPIQVWMYLEPRLIWDAARTAQETLAEFRRRVSELPDSTFQKGAGHALLWVRGHLGKVRNAFEEGDDARTAQVTEWLGYEIACFVALVNRRYYLRSDLRWLRESDSFSHLPKNYRALMMQMHRARDRGEILRTATELCAACEDLAKAHHIEVETIDRLGDIGL